MRKMVVNMVVVVVEQDHNQFLINPHILVEKERTV
jgi:hypothetical protein